MTREQIEVFLRQFDVEGIETVFLIDGHDDAFIGLDASHPPRAIYSVEKIIKRLRKEMSEEEAWEYFGFNIEGAHLGEQTPILVRTKENQKK